MKSTIRSTKSAFLATILFLSYTCSFGANVIFDMGGVLYGTNKARAFYESGINTTLLHILKEIRQSQQISPYSLAALFKALKNATSSQKFKARLFTFLELVEDRAQTTPLAKDDDGNRLLPQIMCSWLTGAYTTKEIRNMIKETAKDHPEFFSNEQEKKRIVAVCNKVIFKPKGFAKTRKLFKNGFEFAKQCKENGHKLYVLSNWDKESFALMQQAYPEVFNLFDDIMISGEAGTVKPDPAIYTRALEKFNIDARESIFIDDLADNVTAAQECGIAAIHVHTKKSGVLRQEKPNFKKVKKDFASWQRIHGLRGTA